MNKLMLPAILAATVMVAGIFAFMPVQQASTVHTTLSTAADLATIDANVDAILVDTSATLTENSMRLITVTTTCTATDATATACDIGVNIAAGASFVLVGYVSTNGIGGDGTADDFDMGALTINGALSAIDPAAHGTTVTTATTVTANFGGIGAGAGTITADPSGGSLGLENDDTLAVTMTFMIDGDAADPILSFS